MNSQVTAGTIGTAGTFGTLATYDTAGTGGPNSSIIGSVSLAVAAAATKAIEVEHGVDHTHPRNGDYLTIPGSHLVQVPESAGGGGGTATSSQQQQQKPSLHDDNGNLIDPLLLEHAIKKQQQKDKEKEKQQISFTGMDSGAGAGGNSVTGSKTGNKSLKTTSSSRRTSGDGRRRRKGERRSKKVVKFDYPPIKSLRQYIRPDRADLPKLFFTEEELDQIEDDRYSTMSTDDIEIVAVSSKEQLSSQQSQAQQSRSHSPTSDSMSKNSSSRKSSATSFASGTKIKNKRNNNNNAGGDNDSEPAYEPGCRPVKGRNSTPGRRRTYDISMSDEENDDACTAHTISSKASRGSNHTRPTPTDMSQSGGNGGGGNSSTANNNSASASSSGGKGNKNQKNKMTSSSPRRLVKGVQIYLRERSTGT
mmetsp:Transcript_44326/g.44965  ORF Transcript_44326/g.44965 Transcript_44326/m.44965 type:complete len:420 (+) Transcript_44326:307-1566(+)